MPRLSKLSHGEGFVKIIKGGNWGWKIRLTSEAVIVMKSERLYVLCVAILVTVLVLDCLQECQAGRVQYQYKKYTYRKKRDDKTYKNLKQPCEVNPDCLAKRGAAQATCIRHCISEFCYNDIYKEDPLEEGEIDVRLNSFKGCCAQKRGK